MDVSRKSCFPGLTSLAGSHWSLLQWEGGSLPYVSCPGKPPSTSHRQLPSAAPSRGHLPHATPGFCPAVPPAWPLSGPAMASCAAWPTDLASFRGQPPAFHRALHTGHKADTRPELCICLISSTGQSRPSLTTTVLIQNESGLPKCHPPSIREACLRTFVPREPASR